MTYDSDCLILSLEQGVCNAITICKILNIYVLWSCYYNCLWKADVWKETNLVVVVLILYSALKNTEDYNSQKKTLCRKTLE